MTKSFLMVCLGNICRSPLAEGILKSKLPKNIIVDSAGTGNWHIGKAPDHRSIKVAKNNGVDISQQKARQFQMSDFETFDVIYAMDEQNFTDILLLAQNKAQKNKVKLILNELNSQNQSVPDPYYGTMADFEHVFNILNKACIEIKNKLEL